MNKKCGLGYMHYGGGTDVQVYPFYSISLKEKSVVDSRGHLHQHPHPYHHYHSALLKASARLDSSAM